MINTMAIDEITSGERGDCGEIYAHSYEISLDIPIFR
jgi:hypothetical protein